MDKSKREIEAGRVFTDFLPEDMWPGDELVCGGVGYIVRYQYRPENEQSPWQLIS